MKSKIPILFLLLFIGCSNDNNFQNVGDIPFDDSIDDPNFELCNEKRIKQYYVRRSSDQPPGYKGEKSALEKIILNAYKYPVTSKVDGYITIRFIVNCKGVAGRFRVEEMNLDYKAIKFEEKISTQLLDIVRKLDQWIPRKQNGKSLDFYQYLSFKISNGQIVKIHP